jgi:two-component system, chemotaxis family, protein-glutamate methylesterase/glutaminase
MRVLVVDDSAVMRQAMTAILGQVPGFDVTVAADPLIAMPKMARERPDVILLDLEMPRMDGLTFLRKIMSEDPIPVVVCSGIAEQGTQAALRAMDEGAVAVVTKPRLAVREFVQESAEMLIGALRDAAAVKLRLRTASPVPRPRLTADSVLAAPRPRWHVAPSTRVVAIGASTGGTEALREVLQPLPVDCPGVVIVQHMPEVFTRAFAERLDRLCAIEVKEAEDGDRVLSGRALVAPGNRHLLLTRRGSEYAVDVKEGPPVSRHRPSVDVLFRSVAGAAGPNAVGVILTGMGHDGAAGLAEMREAGAATIAQDEASCVVFGMPKEAIARGGAQHVVPLSRISGEALRLARGLGGSA